MRLCLATSMAHSQALNIAASTNLMSQREPLMAFLSSCQKLGSYLGVIDLTLEPDGSNWKVTDGTGKIESVAGVTSQNSTVKNAIQTTHQNT